MRQFLAKLEIVLARAVVSLVLLLMVAVGTEILLHRTGVSRSCPCPGVIGQTVKLEEPSLPFHLLDSPMPRSFWGVPSQLAASHASKFEPATRSRGL